MSEKRILFVGLGQIGAPILDLLLRVPGEHRFLVGGRNLEYLQQRTNLAVFSALQLGYVPDVTCAYLNLEHVDQTAHMIAHFRPDIIFHAATLLRWGVLDALPGPISKRLYTAELGPWLPVHLLPVLQLMQAVKQTGLDIQVINATSPGMVGPVLHQVGLAPTTGIGDLANSIPALRMSFAIKLNQPIDQIDVRLVASHYVSRHMTKDGGVQGAPFHLTVLVDGQDVTHDIPMETVFDLLPTAFKRTPGPQMTAVSAVTVFDSLVNNRGKVLHAPGPNGLPGGYPVKVDKEGVQVVLPGSLPPGQAISINTIGQRFDGIEQIEEDGTVYFAEKNMALLKETLGYECRIMPLSEVEPWAEELKRKYLAFAKKLFTAV